MSQHRSGIGSPGRRVSEARLASTVVFAQRGLIRSNDSPNDCADVSTSIFPTTTKTIDATIQLVSRTISRLRRNCARLSRSSIAVRAESRRLKAAARGRIGRRLFGRNGRRLHVPTSETPRCQRASRQSSTSSPDTTRSFHSRHQTSSGICFVKRSNPRAFRFHWKTARFRRLPPHKRPQQRTWMIHTMACASRTFRVFDSGDRASYSSRAWSTASFPHRHDGTRSPLFPTELSLGNQATDIIRNWIGASPQRGLTTHRRSRRLATT